VLSHEGILCTDSFSPLGHIDDGRCPSLTLLRCVVPPVNPVRRVVVETPQGLFLFRSVSAGGVGSTLDNFHSIVIMMDYSKLYSCF
jgi:hypothetical protein